LSDVIVEDDDAEGTKARGEPGLCQPCHAVGPGGARHASRRRSGQAAAASLCFHSHNLVDLDTPPAALCMPLAGALAALRLGGSAVAMPRCSRYAATLGGPVSRM